MSIVSDAEFADYIRDELGSTDAAMRAQALATAHEDVRNYCAPQSLRTFELTATAATARVYAPDSYRDGDTVLRVHDFCTTSGLIVSNNGTIVAAADYQLEPLNGFDVTDEPYTQIRLLSGTWYRYGKTANASITAKWGWDSAPSVAIEAVKSIGKDWVQMRSTNLGWITTEAGPASGGGSNWPALKLLHKLRRPEAWGIA